VVTAYGPEQRASQIRLTGWYQLFDAAPDRSLLVGNTWTEGQRWSFGATWGPIPAVFLVDGTHLLALLDSLGVPPAR
jgi:hypothetical protein